MKINAGTLFLVMAASALVGGQAFSQPNTQHPNVRIDPKTGLPVNTASIPTDSLNPATGLMWNETNIVPLDDAPQPSDFSSNPCLQAQTLTANGHYEQALECYQGIYSQARPATNSYLLKTALPGWVHLGEKYPQAEQALVDIRDRDTREFVQGRGELELLQEVADINQALGDDEATVALFKSIWQKQPSQAKAWYLFAEPPLVQCGEYQLCLDCIGNPETRFKTYCYTFQRLQALYEGMIERSNETRRKLEELSRKPGGPPMPPYLHVNPGKKGLRLTKENYVNEVRRLIEILMGTGHQKLAEKIRGEAVAVLDDPRLQSAMRDAEEKIQQRSTPSATSK